jgi:hypothetical protein
MIQDPKNYINLKLGHDDYLITEQEHALHSVSFIYSHALGLTIFFAASYRIQHVVSGMLASSHDLSYKYLEVTALLTVERKIFCFEDAARIVQLTWRDHVF